MPLMICYYRILIAVPLLKWPKNGSDYRHGKDPIRDVLVMEEAHDEWGDGQRENANSKWELLNA